MKFFNKPKQEIVVSSSDVEAALLHYKQLPQTVTNDMPVGWGKTQVVSWIKEALPKKIMIGETFEVGTGIWGHIKPLGYEFVGYSNSERRYQIVLSFREVITNLNDLVSLELTEPQT